MTEASTRKEKKSTNSHHSKKGGNFDSNKIHPLKNAWTLWYDKLSRNKDSEWGANLQEIITFSTVEDFWRVFNNISPPSELQIGCDYHVFKKGVQPKWEAPENKSGGRWSILINDKQNTDKLWLYMLLGLIGEMIEKDTNLICGCVISIRNKRNKLTLWTKDADDREGNVAIGKRLKKILELEKENFTIGYQEHPKESAQSKTNNKYEV